MHRQKNTRVLLAEVTAVDLGARSVILARESLPYDYLVLATGATHSYFGKDEWERHAPGLKTLEDALEIRRRMLLAFEQAERETDREAVRQWLTFVVIGGGPTGVEMAGAFAEIARHTLARDFRRIDPRTARVILIEAGPRLLAAYTEDLSEKAKTQLEDLGVQVWTGSTVTGVDENGVDVGSDRVAARTVVWGAGVKASPLGRALGAPVDKAGRVLVLPDLTVPGHPDVFVVGDLASVEQDGQPGSRRRAGRYPDGPPRGRERAAGGARRAARAVPLLGQGLARDDRPQPRGGGSWAACTCRASSPGRRGSSSTSSS